MSQAFLAGSGKKSVKISKGCDELWKMREEDEKER